MMDQYQVYGAGVAAPGAQQMCCNLPPPPPPPPQPGMVQANAQGVYENVEVQQFLQTYTETEKDAPEDTRQRLSEPAKFLVPDTTLNLMPSMAGDLLMSLSEGGLQYLLAGARANVGVKSGRYMFEVRVCECPRQEDAVQPQVKPPMPRNLLRIGFGTMNAALLLGDAEDSVSFDSEGNFVFNRRRTQCTQRLVSGVAIAVLLNLTEEGPDANTMSLFRDGERISRPQPIPEILKGKPLFPMITFKNLTVQVNFGPLPLAELPFKCRMINDAAEEDVSRIKYPEPSDGRPEVLFPVFLPGEGTFHWLDWFLKEHPEFTEISDRKMADWCTKSGIKRAWRDATRHSNDKPEMNFGIYALDDGSAKKTLLAAAGLQNRNIVVMEVQGNLSKSERAQALHILTTPGLKRAAKVLLGEPSPDYRQHVKDGLLKEKQARLEKANAQTEEAPVAELTEQEQGIWFRRDPVPDVSPFVLGHCLANLTLPSKAEGFEEVTFGWRPESEASDYLRKWIKEKKIDTRLEDLEPTNWFKERWQVWQMELQTWQRKQAEPILNKVEYKEKQKMATMQQQQGQMNQQNPQNQQKTLTNGENGSVEGKDSKQAPEEEDPEMKDAMEDCTDMLQQLREEIEVQDTDVFSVEDICDVGDGKPLFAAFNFEDWAMLSLRVEMNLLIHAFKHDCGDPDRTGIHPEFIPFYFGKYFRRNFSPKFYGVNTMEELIGLIDDTLVLCGRVVESQVSVELETNEVFVALAEDARRIRQRKLNSGDMSVNLQINIPQDGQFGQGQCCGQMQQMYGQGYGQCCGNMGGCCCNMGCGYNNMGGCCGNMGGCNMGCMDGWGNNMCGMANNMDGCNMGNCGCTCGNACGGCDVSMGQAAGSCAAGCDGKSAEGTQASQVQDQQMQQQQQLQQQQLQQQQLQMQQQQQQQMQQQQQLQQQQLQQQQLQQQQLQQQQMQQQQLQQQQQQYQQQLQEQQLQQQQQQQQYQQQLYQQQLQQQQMQQQMQQQQQQQQQQQYPQQYQQQMQQQQLQQQQMQQQQYQQQLYQQQLQQQQMQQQMQQQQQYPQQYQQQMVGAQGQAY